MTKEEAITMFNREDWKRMTLRERAVFQLNEDKLCMPFEKFHEAVEHALDRSVWTHEFANPKQLVAELEGKIPAPDMQGIIAKLSDIMGGR